MSKLLPTPETLSELPDSAGGYEGPKRKYDKYTTISIEKREHDTLLKLRDAVYEYDTKPSEAAAKKMTYTLDATTAFYEGRDLDSTILLRRAGW